MKKRRSGRQKHISWNGFLAGAAVVGSLFSGMVIADRLSPVDLSGITVCDSEYTMGCTVEDNIDVLRRLREEEWKGLSANERLEVLRYVCHIERCRLGIGREIDIRAAELDENNVGNYVPAEYCIEISGDYLITADAHNVLDLVCHEMFHAVQHQYVQIYAKLDHDERDIYFLRNAAVYYEEFTNYKSGRESENINEFFDYYDQQCERDARDYAVKEAEILYDEIEEALGGE